MKIKTVFNFKCDKKCVVHKLATHNTCWNCSAIRNSPYFQEEVKNMSDENSLADFMSKKTEDKDLSSKSD